ncbi:MAG: ABC transporter ATP-binding protein [Hyphomicrobiaceae bacterium]|nr:ABC transporter ATP-binding protein [Hyphomicrobiaceae bacterium]
MAERPTLALLVRIMRENGRAYAPRYALAFLFMFVFASSTALSAWVMRDVINQIFVDHHPAALAWIPMAILAIFTVKGLASYLQEVILARIGNRFVSETQKRMFDHMLRMDIGFYQARPSNDLIMLVTSSANAARDMLNIIALSFGRDAMTLGGLVVVMVTQDPMMSAICLVGGPFLGLAIKKLSLRIRTAMEGQYYSVSTIISAMRETSQGIRIVKSFQLEGQQRERMRGGIDAVRRMGNRMTAIQAGMNGLVEVLAGVVIALVILYAGWRNFSAGDTPGQFFAFIAALLMASDPLRRLSRTQLQLTAAAVGARMMYDLLDTPVSEKDALGAADLKVTGGEVRFDKVRFAYKLGTPVLIDLSFVAPAGQTTALVGTSGGGKTTIFNLMQGFWAPERGSIAIDGQLVSGLTFASLRRQIALVSQDVFLFDGTIRDNIKAGRQDASDEEVVEAAEAAHADAFIRTLPHGYDTPVGELGTQVSGGQRQRITLARAFLKNAPIILLDEPTSALDSETELVIQRALSQLTNGRTTLVIAHRLATILRADLIHVVEGGRVIESGTHAELLRANGAYARLYHLQFENEDGNVVPLPLRHSKL